MLYELVETNSKRWLDSTPLLNEQFKDIKDYEGLYQVSNYGRVKSMNHKKEKIIKLIYNKNKYLKVSLKRKQAMVHKLVAQTFILDKRNFKYMSDEDKKNIKLDNLVINHKNEIKDDNRVENLEWCTSKYNNNYNNKGKRISKTKMKPVNQYDEKMNFLKEWSSIKEASESLKVNHSNIVACCKNRQKTSYGFVWKYKEDLK